MVTAILPKLHASAWEVVLYCNEFPVPAQPFVPVEGAATGVGWAVLPDAFIKNVSAPWVGNVSESLTSQIVPAPWLSVAYIPLVIEKVVAPSVADEPLKMLNVSPPLRFTVNEPPPSSNIVATNPPPHPVAVESGTVTVPAPDWNLRTRALSIMATELSHWIV